MEFDFGGYVTKNDLLCADGRTIRKGAFKSQNGQKVPLVWMHQRNEPENVLGHAYLEERDDGVYGYCKFNNSPRGKQAKLLVEHGDITSMSIFANNLVQKGGNVTHGMIREVSLVIAPANPGALIDNPVVQHGDEEYEDLTKAMICSGCDLDFNVEFEIEHSEDSTKKKVKMEAKKKDLEDDSDEEIEEDSEEDIETEDSEEDEEDKKMDPKKKQTKSMQHADDDEETDDETVQDVYDSMTEKQKKVVAYMIGAALAENAEDDEDEAEQSDMEGDEFYMKKNVFDREMEMADTTPSLSHDQISCIVEDAKRCGSLKKSFLTHAVEYGIENIDVLFPDAKTVGDNPYMLTRDIEWVSEFLNETTHVPYSKIKSTCADLTADEARAKGYVKGSKKKDEIIRLLKRVTSPTTVYKKQKLDRDDVVDITDLNVIAWVKAEMRVMLNEEVARAGIVGDGREIDDPDKIDEECIRPIWKDDDMYAHHVILSADTTDDDLPEKILEAQEEYKGSGSPNLYAASGIVLKMLLLKDKIGRRLYPTEPELSAAIGVKKINRVPVMERQVREDNGKKYELVAIVVNPRDYTYGATEGGKVGMFDDFDIDYNQYKYLLETRCCGALTKPKSAIVIEREVAVSSGSGTEDVG